MNFGDLIDLDRQLHHDRSAENDEQRLEREERIGRSLREMRTRGSEEALLLAWKNNVDPEAGPSFGSLFQTASRWTAFLLAFFGILLGWGAAAALLRQPSGQETINLVYFLGAIVGIQLLLLPFLAIAFLFRSRLHSDLLFARRMIRALLEQVFIRFARFVLSPEKAAALRADFGTLTAESSLYKQVQSLLLLLLLQVFSFAFNLAAAATLLFFVLFTELNFSWETTLDAQAKQVHRLTSVLSLPWASFAPQARPTLEQVEATQSRTKRQENRAQESRKLIGNPDLVDKGVLSRGWWRFLFAATIVYGLLPRLLALTVSGWLLKREIGRSLARSSGLQALKERLRAPIVHVRRPETAIVEGEIEELEEENRAEPKVTVAAPIDQGLKFAVVFWAYDEIPSDETVDELLRQRIDASAIARFEAGQLEESDEAVMEKIAKTGTKVEFGGAAVFIEPFEPPKADLRRFLGLLRKTLGASLPIVVFLAEFEGEKLQLVERGQWEIWERGIRSFGDPFLLLNEREIHQ